MLSEKYILPRLLWKYSPIFFIVSMLFSSYYAIYWEMFYWGKSLSESFIASRMNWIILDISVFMLFARFLLNRRVNKQEIVKSDDPWSKPLPKVKKEDQDSFGVYVTEQVQGFDKRMQRDFGMLGKKKIHMRFLRQMNRLLATCLFVLYLVMGLVALPNVIAFLFLLTSYLSLGYLWKSRRKPIVEAR